MRRDFPTEFLVGFFHEFRIKRILVILGAQRLGDPVTIFQPFRDARVFLAPQCREGIAVSRLVEIVVELGLLKKERSAE